MINLAAVGNRVRLPWFACKRQLRLVSRCRIYSTGCTHETTVRFFNIMCHGVYANALPRLGTDAFGRRFCVRNNCNSCGFVTLTGVACGIRF